MKFGSRTRVANLPNDIGNHINEQQPANCDTKAGKNKKKKWIRKIELAEYARTEKSLKRLNFIA